jgi:glycosyltransferase involved in cell wall biosynthesis
MNLAKDLLYSLRMARLLPKGHIVVSNTFWFPAFASFYPKDIGAVAVHVARMPKGQLALYDRVSRLQAVSQAVRQEIIAQRPALAPKVRVFPYPVDTHAFRPQRFRRDVNRPPVILYTGRLHPEKGLDLLIDAFTLLTTHGQSASLRIVGPWRIEDGGGGISYLESLKARAAGSAVEFLDPIYDRETLAKVYQKADLYCYPSLAERGETFGVAPLEAMATGLVPVVSDLACFRDFIEHGVTGCVSDHRSPDAPALLARTLAELIVSPDTRAAMGERAMRRAHALSYENVADLYLADFAEMALHERN